MALKNIIYNWLIFIVVAVLMVGCTADQRRNMEPNPMALGKTNEIVVVADKNLWESPVGDSLRYYLQAPYLILPQPEPTFDLRFFSVEDLNSEPLRRQLRTYLIIGDLKDEHSRASNLIKEDLRSENIRRAKTEPDFTSTAGRNKWAQGQLLVYLFGFGEQALIENIRKDYPAIMSKVHSFDKKQVDRTAYAMGTNEEANALLAKEMSINMKVPRSFSIALQDEDFIWLRKETREVSNNIMVYKVPYTDKSQLTKKGLKDIRNALGKKYITTEIEGAYMQINDVDLPMLVENIQVNGNFVAEARGIWEIVDDFMGGPFISYALLNEAKGEIIFMDGFIHAPGLNKRDNMQIIEHIFKSVNVLGSEG